MNDVQKENRRDNLILGVILIGLICFVLVGYGLKGQSVQSQKNSDFTACISHWATQVTQRTNALAGLNTDRSNRLDVLLRDVYSDTTGHPPSRAKARREKRKFTHDLRSYVRVSNMYKKAIKTHPAPPAPAVQC